jgi:hypothetical protein
MLPLPEEANTHQVKPSLVRAVHAAITARALKSKTHHQSAPAGAHAAALLSVLIIVVTILVISDCL